MWLWLLEKYVYLQIIYTTLINCFILMLHFNAQQYYYFLINEENMYFDDYTFLQKYPTQIHNDHFYHKVCIYVHMINSSEANASSVMKLKT